jgi:4-diphosphocytidyl-2-C-methyl-D-erythritol kinase
MVCFPHAKINLGLRILRKRADGFHDLDTCFFPVFELCDVLEMIEGDAETLELEGADWQGNKSDNLVWRAYQMFRQSEPNCPKFNWYLLKKIPSGGGLGGGSSDAAFALRMLAEFCGWPKNDPRLFEMAAALGSDCAFFLLDGPAIGSSRGEILNPVEIPQMKGMEIKLVFPDIQVSTTQAFSKVKPQFPEKDVKTVLHQDIFTWKADLINDFEGSVFPEFSGLEDEKLKMYNEGAIYAAMSGSGSTLFGIFKNKSLNLTPKK